VKETEEWTRQIVELLNQLQDVLSETVKAWERFNSENGDIDYFSDIDFSENRCRGSLSKIKETFEVLESHQRTLQKLSKSCHDSAQNVSPSSTFLSHDQLLPYIPQVHLLTSPAPNSPLPQRDRSNNIEHSHIRLYTLRMFC